MNRRLPTALFAIVLLVTGCAGWQAPSAPPEPPGFMARAETETIDGVSVTAAALSASEAKAHFGLDLFASGIQPVWLRIDNRTDKGFWFAPRFLDPMYFTPSEAAYKNHTSFTDEENAAMSAYFEETALEPFVKPHSVGEGFVHVEPDGGLKVVNVLLFGDRDQRLFEFLLDGGNLDPDYRRVDFWNLYPPEQVREVDLAGLRQALADLPCCAANAGGAAEGDPLNIVLVGDGVDVLAAMVRAGWDETETLSAGSAAATAGSFLFGSRYRYSPVSPLYLFERPHDAAFQKARETIHERNHLRLWLAPFLFEGSTVWVGQISRDIGVRMTSRTWNLTTHAIDPEVDAERWYLLQDLAAAGAVAGFGFVEGVGVSSRRAPRENLTGDIYITDGLRLVVFIADEPNPISAIDAVRWAEPPSGPAREALLAGEGVALE